MDICECNKKINHNYWYDDIDHAICRYLLGYTKSFKKPYFILFKIDEDSYLTYYFSSDKILKSTKIYDRNFYLKSIENEILFTFKKKTKNVKEIVHTMQKIKDNLIFV